MIYIFPSVTLLHQVSPSRTEFFFLNVSDSDRVCRRQRLAAVVPAAAGRLRCADPFEARPGGAPPARSRRPQRRQKSAPHGVRSKKGIGRFGFRPHRTLGNSFRNGFAGFRRVLFGCTSFFYVFSAKFLFGTISPIKLLYLCRSRQDESIE